MKVHLCNCTISRSENGNVDVEMRVMGMVDGDR